MESKDRNENIEKYAINLGEYIGKIISSNTKSLIFFRIVLVIFIANIAIGIIWIHKEINVVKEILKQSRVLVDYRCEHLSEHHGKSNNK